ncbi:gliding motility lipoprotein GldB [uncultured Polaribacter sp.]|uniref:gliding motility lipoprotein GldB n=1 Tax=uncultured Polaribacter sp. TaxID=174711 RepID=UPI002622C0E3|nr:gliding motility lipoprotein GldB [uncultured Polaribacter sp.]
MRFLLLFLTVLLLFFSCSEKNIKKVDVSKIDIDLYIDRYDIDFYNATPETLPKIKQKYPYFFPLEFTDSLSFAKINDKQEQELFKETQKKYSNFSEVENQLTSLFKHVKYYNTKFTAPKIITMLTNIDYDSRVIYADSLLLVSLDVYLGKNHQFYNDYPKYIKENNTKNHIVVDVAKALINKQFSSLNNRSFVEKIIYEGKKMYLLDMYLPEVSNKEKIGYSQEKIDWAEANEEQIWMYFIEKDLLFSTDTKINKRFLEDAPFSKFYLEHDNLSPGKIGVWVGWQIVKSYMNHNDVSLQELLKITEIDLYNKSKYKPKK